MATTRSRTGAASKKPRPSSRARNKDKSERAANGGGVLAGVLAGLTSKRDSDRKAAVARLDALGAPGHDWRPNWSIPEGEAIAILVAARDCKFVAATDTSSTGDPQHELLFGLIKSPYPSLVEPITPLYRAGSPVVRCGALTLLAAIGTREAAERFITLVREDGFPERTYGRLFAELTKLLAFPTIMLPDLVRLAGPHETDVLDAVVRAAGAPKASTKAMGKALGPVAAILEKRLDALLKRAEARSAKAAPGAVAWRFTETYETLKRDVTALLGLFAFLESARAVKLLRRGLVLRDPAIVLQAALGLEARGERVPSKVWSLLAESDETRARLFEGLESLGRDHLDRFPSRFRTWDAFARAEMMGWLMHPSELGRPADALEKMAEVSVKGPAGPAVVVVWRFREGKRVLASVSGPYALKERRKAPRPVWSPATFSRFERWDAATPEGHVHATLEMLEGI